MDLLIDLRIEDATTNILMDTEKRFTARVEELKEERRREEEAAKEEEASGAGKDKKGFSSRPAAKKATGVESNTPQVSLEKQIEELHQKMEAEAQEAVEQMEKEVIAEVNAMTPEKARELVNTQYEPSRIPSYFTSVDELLDVFISVEESNLFLIQNCQELEEELEEVAMQYMTEKSEMQAMVHQRQAQMDGLSEKIQAATEKLNQLEENKRQLDGADAGLDTAGDPAKGKDGGAAVTMSRETFKEKIEEKIAYIFRTLTAGDTAIKAAMTSHDSEEGAGADPLLSPPGTTTTKSKTTPGEGTKKASPKPSAKSTKGKSGVDSTKRSAPAVHATQESEAGQNIGAVEMLTIIENKLEEYHRYIVDADNAVPDQVIQQVMKNSDKERRRQARHEHMIQQAAEQEEKVRKALERSNAPIKKQAGKPVLKRSHVEKKESEAVRKRREAEEAAKDDGEEFFR
ncbi:hypothetical protein AGDE_10643 [Angomonas deanei]|nr:hypothetical protein AGDE_10643 [Angomonas deanei]|eukprot:EPY27684.1 hypothetical protein AGDE_10643 [Angomonas deanei]